MIVTLEFLPHPELRPYVRCYGYREFDTRDAEMIKPILAINEVYMTFFMDDSDTLLARFSPSDSLIPLTQFRKDHVLGIQTRFKGVFLFRGKYRIFSIQYRPNGFYRIFGIPSRDLTDEMQSSDLIFGNRMNLNQLSDTLNESPSMENMTLAADFFLLKCLNKSNAVDPFDQIGRSSRMLYQNSSLSVAKLAHSSNMSLRSFESKYLFQVGINPKLYSRINRFNKAIMMNMLHPEMNWTAISLECNYFDQNHFIKDFKTFSGAPPTRLLKLTPPPKENFNQIIE